MAGQRFSRRWLLVAAGAAAIVGVSAVQLPAAALDVDAEALRRCIRAEVPPYVGYAEASGRLGLPEIPQLESVTTLLTTTTRIRSYVAGADRWRADQLTGALGDSERDTYHLGAAEYVWDFGGNQLTRVLGQAPLRLPRAGDLLPPDLARRMLGLAPGDPVTAIPARRIAGRDAAGIRLVPTDPDTTVGRVDIWADPTTALPLRVEIAARTGPTLLVSELLEVTDGPPDPAVLRPVVPPGAGAVTASAADLSGALRDLRAPPAPARLAGRARLTLPSTPGSDLPGVGVYGTGLAGFVLIPTGRDVADRAVDGATAAGGTAIPVPFGRAARIGTPLLSVAVRSTGRRGSLLIGTVAADVLQQALLELPARGRPS
ncbi:hypothetical protein [Pseudonocardia sp. 73-21]|uniref:hypothetical protein n=1 Tax=Pseudonocardia sp. 73-21 TaxID=1895809 RepID=UPI00095F7915|nr:hypothetical protein [Pseudonocardia sp. 73-21]OJY46868.1 MAG: hypothetical protein BGP03_27480 [Pseudonocardia sp. 73-21]